MHKINLPQNIAPRDVPSDWCNAIQEEICTVIEKAGVQLQASSQLNAAIDFHFKTGGPQWSCQPNFSGRQQMNLPWTPVDSTTIQRVSFLTTLVSQGEDLNEKSYQTSSQSFFYEAGEWRDIGERGLVHCEISADGNLFVSIEGPPQLLDPLQAPQLLIISHLERVPSEAN